MYRSSETSHDAGEVRGAVGYVEQGPLLLHIILEVRVGAYAFSGRVRSSPTADMPALLSEVAHPLFHDAPLVLRVNILLPRLQRLSCAARASAPTAA